MQSRSIKVLCGVLSVGLAAAGWYTWDTTRTKTVTVVERTATVTLGDVAEKVSASGSVSSPAAATLTFDTTGTLLKLDVAKGDRVTKGQVLAEIDATASQTTLNQAKGSLATAQARLEQSRAGLTSLERQQLDLQARQSAMQLENAQRTVRETRASIAASSPTYTQQLETADLNVGNALASAATNARNYQNTVDQARTALENARQNAEFSAKNYQVTVDTAKSSLEVTKRTGELNAKNYQLSVDQAGTSVENAKVNAGFSASTSQNSVDQAASALSVEATVLSQYQNEQGIAQTNASLASADYASKKAASEAAPTDGPLKQASDGAKVVLEKAQASLDTANSRVTQQQKALTSASNQLRSAQQGQVAAVAKDGQSVKAAEQSQLASAVNAQVAGLEKDLNSIKASDLAVVNAVNAQAASLAKDAQSLRSNEITVANALVAQETGLAKDQQQIVSAQIARETVVNSQEASRVKDRQQLTSSEASLRSAELNLATSRLGNQIKVAPAKQADLLSATAAVETAKAAVLAAEKSVLEGTVLVAPFDGVVSAQTGIVGTTVGGTSSAGGNSTSNSAASSSSGTASIEITSVNPLIVKAGFSEANAAKIQRGQSVAVSFDALPSVSLVGAVQSIDQTATAVSGVATYYASVELPGAFDQGVKPGMTAQVEVSTKEAVGVLLLPSNAVTKRGQRAFVTRRENGVDTRTPIEIGVIGEAGTEIASGLSEGQLVVIPQATIQSTTGIAGRGVGGGTGGLPGGGAGGGAGGLGRGLG